MQIHTEILGMLRIPSLTSKHFLHLFSFCFDCSLLNHQINITSRHNTTHTVTHDTQYKNASIKSFTSYNN